MNPTDDERWAALRRDDHRMAGGFVYAVRTTGIYCRPGCPSRRPNRDNVCFFDNGAAAERAGFRACKRCTPDRAAPGERQRDRIVAACWIIEDQVPAPSLSELAGRIGMSPHHLQRRFTHIVGLSPHRYGQACRDRRLRDALARYPRVTDAVLAAGYESTGHFYAGRGQDLGMPARQYADGGPGQPIRFALGQTTLGAILVAGTTRGICVIALDDDPQALVRSLQDRFARAELIGDDAVFKSHVARIVGFVETPSALPDLPLDIQGTVFQQRVWQALRALPCGTTASYAEIAAAIGAPRAFRAVAGACAANPLALAIPCHRVVRSDGALSGYRWGIERKRALLEREARAARKDRPDEN